MDINQCHVTGVGQGKCIRNRIARIGPAIGAFVQRTGLHQSDSRRRESVLRIVVSGRDLGP